jgi:outer membrane protein
MTVRRSLAPSMILIASLLFGPSARAEMRVAVVDVQRAVMQTEDGLRAQANLKKLFDSRQQELNAKQTAMQKEKDEIEKQSRVISKEALAARADAWQKKMMELQQVFMEYNKELEKKQKEITDPIFEKVMGIVKRLATTENFDLVIDKTTVAYVRTDLDLTDRCIQIYNSGGAVSAPTPSGPSAPAPGAGASPGAMAPLQLPTPAAPKP